jgi:hypothetical protein
MFPIQRKHRTANILRNMIDEKISLTTRIIAHCIMIHAYTLTGGRRTNKLIIRNLTDTVPQTRIPETANTPRNPGYDKIRVKLTRVYIALPVAYVNPAHIRARGRCKHQQ